MESSKIRFAFAALGDIDRKTRTDPRYVKWLATWDAQQEDGTVIAKPLPIHECTQADLDEFFQLNPADKALFEATLEPKWF